MGNTDSTKKLGERVLAGKRKLEDDRGIQSSRCAYLKDNSPEIMQDMVKSIVASLKNRSPFFDPTLLIAWEYDETQCKQAILSSCRKVLSAPILRSEYEWFIQYVFPSSIWMFKTKDGKYMYEELLNITRDLSQNIIKSMDSIFNHLTFHPEWKTLQKIKNETIISRQDDKRVGLLQEKGIREMAELKTNNIQDLEMKIFIDTNLAINNLTTSAKLIDKEFQNHVKTVMSSYGDFKPGPMKKVERCLSKIENDYAEAKYPKSAKLLDIVRCAVTFNTIEQLIVGYDSLIKHINTNGTIIQLARIKNGFLDGNHNGYRDLKVNVVYKSQINIGVNMIVEIQLLLLNYLHEKKRIHKLYSILREELYFQMVVTEQDDSDEKSRDITDLKFIPSVNVMKDMGSEITIKYTEDFFKTSVQSELGLLGIEGIDWFGVVNLKQKKIIFDMRRDAPWHPWYAKQSHHWIEVNNENYVSVQTAKGMIQMYKVTQDNKFVEDISKKIVIAPNKKKHEEGIINFCEFDKQFDNILIVINYKTLQTRSVKNINNIVSTIELEEKIKQSTARNLILSDDGSICCIGGGGQTSYFYLIHIENKQQYKIKSSFLTDTYAPCFINGDTKLLAISDKHGRLEVYDVGKRTVIKTITIDTLQWICCISSRSNIMAIGSMDKYLRLYDVRNWQCFYSEKYKFQPVGLHLTADLQYVSFSGLGGDKGVVLKIE